VIVTLLSLPASVLGNEAALRYGRHRAITAVMVASAAVGVAIGLNGDRSQELNELLNELGRKKVAATTEWHRVQGEWQTRAGSQAFDAKRSELERLKQELDQLPNVRLRKLEELKARQHQLQMEEFLDRFEISNSV
jgi:hypothetical protein